MPVEFERGGAKMEGAEVVVSGVDEGVVREQCCRLCMRSAMMRNARGRVWLLGDSTWDGGGRERSEGDEGGRARVDMRERGAGDGGSGAGAWDRAIREEWPFEGMVERRRSGRYEPRGDGSDSLSLGVVGGLSVKSGQSQ